MLKMLTMLIVAAGLRVIEGGGIHVSYVIGGVLSVLAILILIAALIIYRWVTLHWNEMLVKQDLAGLCFSGKEENYLGRRK